MSVTPDSITEELKVTQPAHWEFWGTVLWGALIGFVFVVMQTMVITISVILHADAGYLSNADFKQSFIASATNGYILSVVTIVTTIVCTSLVIGIIKLKKSAVLKEYLCLRPVPIKAMLQWTGILAVFIALANMIGFILGRPVVTEFMSVIYTSAQPLWLLWAALIIAAPLFEEIYFRGFLFQGFTSSFMGPTGAVFVTAGLWASVHTQYDTYDKVVIFCLGLLLGAVRVRTGSLLAAFGLHALSNLESTLEAALFG